MTTAAPIAPIHPGEILAEEYLGPLGITQHKLAVAIAVPPRRINEIVHGTLPEGGAPATTPQARLRAGGVPGESW